MKRLSLLAAFAVAAALIAVLPDRISADPPARPAKMAEFALSDQSGAVHRWKEIAGAKAVVVVFTGTQCPECNRYLPELEKLAKEYAARGVKVLGVNSNRNEQGEIEAHAKESGTTFPVLKDGEHTLADAMGINITPTVLVIGPGGEIAYRGRIDRTWMGSAPTGEDVRAALDCVLAGTPVAKPETEPRGCTVRRDAPKKDGDVTWTKDIAPIIFANCTQCHRAGQVGPMPLTDFKYASGFAQEIKEAVTSRNMPPWKPVRGVEMHGERRLTDDQIALITRWADNGTPEGDKSLEPALPEFQSDWLLGEPDMILDAGVDFEVPPGPDLYWHFVMPNNWDADKWVSAVEVRPGNARIVHHVLGYLDQTGTADKLDAEDEGIGYKGSGAWPGFVPTGEMGGWTPGFYAHPLPDGVARLLPKKARLVLQIHYNNPTGKTLKDRSQIGLHFAKAPVRQRLYQARILNPWFKIPAGDPACELTAAWPVHRDITVISVMPHCHLIGRKVTMIAETASGKKTSLVEIDDWDFKWQDTYHLAKPMKLKNGSRVNLSITYDNSENNPKNPYSPPRNINWGENTTDEMCLGYVNYVRDHEDLSKKKKPSADEDDDK